MVEAVRESAISDVSMPPRKGRLETYLWDYGDEISATVAEDFYDATRPIQPFGVLIPVAAHQDAGYIESAIAHYAAQEEAEPFTVFLLLNYPSAAMDKAQRCLEEVERIKQIHPTLDIRYSASCYDKFTIGQIRKDLWDGVMRVALTDGLYDTPGQEMICINHDIDTESLARHYMRNVQRHYRSKQQKLEQEAMVEHPLPSLYTQVKHAYPFATHPNIAKVTFWTDFMYRQTARNGMYEEGTVIPLSYYAKQGGFRPEDSTHETRDMAPRDDAGIPGTSMETSPRRYIARLGEHGIRGIWSDDSFTALDACRDPEELPSDITYRQLEDSVLDTLDDALYFFGNSVPHKRWQSIKDSAILNAVTEPHKPSEYVDRLNLKDAIAKELAPRFQLARKVLERVVGVSEVAQLIDENRLNYHVRELEHAMKQVICEEVTFIRIT